MGTGIVLGCDAHAQTLDPKSSTNFIQYPFLAFTLNIITISNNSFENTKSGAGLQFLLLGRMANAHGKYVFFHVTDTGACAGSLGMGVNLRSLPNA